MKPVLQKIPRATNASSILLDRRLDDSIPFQWHHHPEFELTLTLNSRGQRFIGDHIGAYDDGDLVLVGSNLPHTWHSSGKIDGAEPHVALVLWFHPEWVERLDDGFVELTGVKAMFERSAPGLQFTPEVAARVRPLFEGLRRLAPEERLPDVLSLLTILAREQQVAPLSSRVVTPSGRSVDRGRLDRVLDHIHLHIDGGTRRPCRPQPFRFASPVPAPPQHAGLGVSDAVEDRRSLRAPQRLWTIDRPHRRSRGLSLDRQLQSAVQGGQGHDAQGVPQPIPKRCVTQASIPVIAASI